MLHFFRKRKPSDEARKRLEYQMCLVSPCRERLPCRRKALLRLAWSIFSRPVDKGLVEHPDFVQGSAGSSGTQPQKRGSRPPPPHWCLCPNLPHGAFSQASCHKCQQGARNLEQRS